MASLFAVLHVARDGMLAQTGALDITAQNVTNAGTAGYTRRLANLETVPSTGAFGSVRLGSVGRAFDRFAEGRSLQETGKRWAASARSSTLASIETILAPPGVPSISDEMASFFSAMSTLAQNPADPSTRSAALASAQSLAQSVSATADELSTSRASLLTKAQGVADEVNTRLVKIADLNKRIAAAKGLGETPADLMDQRDQLVREVGERIGAQAVEQSSGSTTLLSSGAALVDGDRAAAITVGADSNGDLSFQLVRGGGVKDDITKGVTTGTLGGLREARDVDLVKTMNGLDQLAYDLSTTVNAVHTTGYGLDGQTGRPLFAPPTAVAGAARAMAVDPAVVANPKAIATAKTAGGLPAGNDIALAIAALSEKPLGGAPTPAQAFASVGATLGSAKQAADGELELRDATLQQANNLRDSAGGVSLDEEMVNLSKYQRAFEASAKVLSTVNELLADLVKGL